MPPVTRPQMLAAMETCFIALGLVLSIVMFDLGGWPGSGEPRIPAGKDWPTNWAALAS